MKSEDGQHVAVDRPQHNFYLTQYPNREMRLDHNSDGQQTHDDCRHVAVFCDQSLHRLVSW